MTIQNSKSTNINVLLNRVKLDQKEKAEKILFTAATSFELFCWRFNFKIFFEIVISITIEKYSTVLLNLNKNI